MLVSIIIVNVGLQLLDAGLFIFRSEHGFVIAVIYVDDALFCGPNKALVLELKQKFMQRWECRDLGDVTEFLRMSITQYSGKVHIDQRAYLETVLERSLGAKGVIPGRYIVSFLRVFKQFTHTLPSR